MNQVARAKSALRRRMRDVTRNLSPDDFLVAGILIARNIDRWLSLTSLSLNYKAVGMFASLKDEIATGPLNALLEQLGLVRSWPQITTPGHMQFEPSTCLDIIFVPGLAFDLRGHRLGRGLGYYDRYLTGIDQAGTRPILVGLALDAQVIDAVPVEDHDIAMDFICTPGLGVLSAQHE